MGIIIGSLEKDDDGGVKKRKKAIGLQGLL